MKSIDSCNLTEAFQPLCPRAPSTLMSCLTLTTKIYPFITSHALNIHFPRPLLRNLAFEANPTLADHSQTV